ncbi:MAG: hypothetical protein M3Z04_13175 [Chloroflexota bacterium]|nr:hypothetical protein [Chloroflexota bacterium]
MIQAQAEGAYVGRALRQPVLWLLLVATALAAVLAYQVRRPVTLDIGTPADRPYLRNFHEVRSDPDGRTYRASDAYGYVVVPGLGGGVPVSVTLSLNAGRSDTPVTILINGTSFLDRTLPAGWHTYSLALDAAHPAALAARDLVIEIRTPPGRGVLLDRVEVGAPGPGVVTPALSQLGSILAIVALLWLALGRVFRNEREDWPAVRPPSLSNARNKLRSYTSASVVLLNARNKLRPYTHVPAVLAAAALVGGLALNRPAVTTATPALLLWSGIVYALAVGAEPLARVLGPEVRLAGRLLAQPALWAVLALTLGGLIAAYQVRHSYSLDLGSPSDQAYVSNFQDRDAEPNASDFRFSGLYSYVTLPGLGGGVPYTLSVTLKPVRVNLPITLILDGAPLFQGPISGTWQTLTFRIDSRYPQALASRDGLLELRTPAVRSVAVDRVEIGAQEAGFVMPALGQLAGLGGLVLLVYLLLGRALAPHPLARRISLGGAGLAGVTVVAGLAAFHLPLTVATGHLLLTAGLSYVLLGIGEAVLRRVAPEAGLGARWAAAIFAAAFALRFGGMALPQSVIIDMPYHMKWMRELLAGNLAALTDPHGGLNQPPREWGLAVVIPKSPLFYFVAAPLALLPGNLETAIKALVCLLDASAVPICYGLLARYGRTVGGWRAGLGAAFVYAATPLTYRALAYGILPTILAQWLAVVFFAALVAWAGAGGLGSGGRSQGAVGGRQSSVLRYYFSLATFYFLLVLLLAAALVAFPTIAVFTTLVTGGVAGTWIVRRRWQGWAVLGILTAAWALAIATYYGVYINDLILHTLPQLFGPRSAGTAGAPGGSTVHWRDPLDLLGWTAGYLVSLLPLLLGLTGLALLWRGGRQSAVGSEPLSVEPELRTQNSELRTLVAWWVAILPIFVVVNYRVDMIGKHLFYTMVPLALGSGIVLAAGWRRGGWTRWWVRLLGTALVWSALAFWIERLVRASS